MFEKDSIKNQMIMLLKESGGNFSFQRKHCVSVRVRLITLRYQQNGKCIVFENSLKRKRQLARQENTLNKIRLALSSLEAKFFV